MTPEFNKNTLSPLGFKLAINSTDFPVFEYFCTQVTWPGVSLPAIDGKYKNLQAAIAGDSLRYDPLTVQFIIDENMKNYLELYDWLYKNAREAITYRDLTLNILSNQSTSNLYVQFMNATITSLGSFEFSTQSTEVNNIICTADFSYDAFKISVQ